MNLSPRFFLLTAVQLSAACCFVWLAPSIALAQTSSCDLNQDSMVNVGDVQLSVNMTLGLTPCTANITAPGVCDIVVVQRVVNAAIGGSCVTDSGPASHSVHLTWTPSSSSNVVGHNIYRGPASSGPFNKLNSSLVAVTNYTDSTVQSGQTYFYVVTAVNNSNLESNFSNAASAPIPSP